MTRADLDAAAVAERSAPPDPDTPFTGVPLFEPPAAVRGATPLGLPYPEPTDPLADAALHVKALSDRVTQVLAAPGRIWGQNVVVQNQYGGFWVYTGSLAAVQSYNVQGGYRGGTTAAQGYIFLFVMGGTWNSTGVTCNCFNLAGVATNGLTTEHSFTGANW